MHAASHGRALALRHIKRHGLLQLATEASDAVAILTDNPRVRLKTNLTTRETYEKAIEEHLRIAVGSTVFTARAKSLTAVAVLVRFFRELGQLDEAFRIDLPAPVDPDAMHALAGETLAGRDSYLGVVAGYRRARDLRLDGRLAEAKWIAARPIDRFTGSGAEMYLANYQLEHTYANIVQGNAVGAANRLREQARRWSDERERAHGLAARGIFDTATAAAALARDELLPAQSHLRDAATRLARYPDPIGRVERLAVNVLQAEIAAFADTRSAASEQVISACESALAEFDGVRQSWATVARAPTPLSLVLRMVLGDLAATLATVGSTHAARVGLRLAVSAKHSGFAELVRRQRNLLDRRSRNFIEAIVDDEAVLTRTEAVDEPDRETAERRLAENQDRLREKVSDLLADLVLPTAVDVQPIFDCAHARPVVDFVRLPALATFSDGDGWTFALRTAWYRTSVYAPDDAEFADVELGAGYDALFTDGLVVKGTEAAVGLLDAFSHPDVAEHPAWRLAAKELLPERLLVMASQGEITEMLVSPHRELSRVPWSALVIDDEGQYLVERAAVVQTPLLAIYQGQQPPPVTGPALVHLVNDPAIHPEREQRAWGTWRADAPLPVAACSVPASAVSPQPLEGSLGAQLADREADWGLTYVSSHGGGSGFRQHLVLDPDFTAGQALGLPWPPNVVLNACLVGALEDGDDAEPMGFVIAAMAGGARCVVGALHVIGARGAARLGAAIIERMDGRTPLPALLSSAQRAIIGSGAEDPVQSDLRGWAPLAVYVR